MDTKTALGAAAGISLVMAGGATAFALTIGAGNDAAPTDTESAIIEYVDEAGNPLPAISGDGTSQVIVVDAPGARTATTTPPSDVTGYAQAAEPSSAEAYPDSEAEYDPEEEDEDEHGYEAAAYEEDDDE